jgi:mannose-6-phosphate isomerase-like protein (cupin superfamily)
MAIVVGLDDLRTSPTASLFEGADHGIDVSFFVVDSTPGKGPSLHVHPYPEAFVVHDGEATVIVGDEEIVLGAGQVVVGPADVPHRFTNTGTGRLLMTTIHAAGRTETTWLEEGE